MRSHFRVLAFSRCRAALLFAATLRRGIRRPDSRIPRAGLFARRAVFPGKRKRDLDALEDSSGGAYVDLIGSRERAYINKIYLGRNTGILYRVEIEAGTSRR